jgi:hypothetical protein
MSTRYKRSEDVPNEILAARLDDLAKVITTTDKRMDSEFCMRIPAELDRDADLVMAEAARRLRAINDKGTVFGR